MTSHEIIGSDGALTAAQRETLVAVLDMIIPASEAGRFPSAADIDVLDHIRESQSHLLPALREDLGRLDRLAAERAGSAFAHLTDSDRSRTVSGTSKKDYPNGEQESHRRVCCVPSNRGVMRAHALFARCERRERVVEAVSYRLSV